MDKHASKGDLECGSAQGEQGMKSTRRPSLSAGRLSCPSWPSYEFDRTNAKNATIVFSASLFDANLRKPGQQGQAMPATATYSRLTNRPLVATFRTLIWIQDRHFQGWGCSECAWMFRPSGPPAGNSLQEMKENYLRLRDEELAAHICAEHLGAKRAKSLNAQRCT
jgi:hypothetical protein